MSKVFSGLTADTAKHLQLDAGMLIKNYDKSKDYEGNKANIVGATAGGGSFSAVPTIRQVEVDGKKGSVKGFQVIDEWVVTLTENVKEITANTLKMSLAAADVTSAEAPAGGYTSIKGRSDIQDADYLENVAWVGKLSGAEQPVIIILYNALATNGLALTFADKAEAVIPMTLTGHYDLSDLETPPFEILYPPVTL